MTPRTTELKRAARTGMLLVVAAAAGALAAGLADLPSRLVGLSLAVALSSAAHTVLLVRLALGIHRRQHSFGPCRGSGFLGMGVLASGVTTVGACAARSAYLALGGLVVAVALFLLGLLLLPDTASAPGARLRRLVDGLAVGICLLFTAWLTLIAPQGGPRTLNLVVGLICATAVAVTAVTALRAVRYRRAALACGGGAALSILGLATLVILLSPEPVPIGWWPATGAALVAGPLLATVGARRSGVTVRTDEPDAPSAFPVLPLPVATALLATAYHLITVGVLDRTAIVLGIGGVAAIALREALAAVDVRRYARQLADREAHFRSLVAGSSDVTVVLDADLVVTWQSPAAARHFGLSDQDVLGRPVVALIHPEDAGRVVEALTQALAGGEPGLVGARLRDGFGRWRDTESTVNDLRHVRAVGALVVHVRDVGERRELERTLQRMAFTDQLTGLANRREALRALAARRLEGTGCALAIDLDGLTGVNDVRGHEVGDAVLIEVARRLRSGVDETDVVARLGGDEFLVLTPAGQVRAYALALRLVTVLGEPYRLPGATVHLSASAGLAEVAGTSTVDEVLGRADLALRRAQRAGRGRVEWYDESMAVALLRRMALEQELPGAATRGEFDLVYQPVVELAYRNPVGVEALLRWRHPKLGTVMPAEVVPVAEELGLADQLAQWVLHRACRQLSGWLRDGWDLWLSVNASPVQLTAPGFAGTVAEAVSAHLVPPDRLLVEVPAAPDLGDALDAVRTAGVRTALDHFGSGPVSLADLRGLAVDMLKVDRSLFTEPAAPILDVVVDLASRLGSQVVAETLEAEAHLDAVRAAGCRYGQGYLFARPAPAEHLEAYLEEHRTHML